MLEDDLYVSPYFYEYAKRTADYYEGDENIAGVSLYNHSFNEVAVFPFYAVDDGSDVYFLQIASSWGQLFWGKKWKIFLEWYNNHTDLTKVKGLPNSIRNWSEHSWKKYFIGYLVDTKKYFVYPRISLTTNFSDAGGENNRKCTPIHQVPILMGKKKWVLKNFKESDIKYDSYCEIKADYFKEYNAELIDYNFEVDLYGTKPLQNICAPFIITSKPTTNPITKFGLDFKTLPLNLNYSNEGTFFVLTDKKNCYDSILEKVKRKIKFFNCFYRKTSVKMYLLLIINKILNK
jgi:hypothetical protein